MSELVRIGALPMRIKTKIIGKHRAPGGRVTAVNSLLEIGVNFC